MPTPDQNNSQTIAESLKALARLLARQTARDLESVTFPGASPEHAANDKEHRHDADDQQDR